MPGLCETQTSHECEEGQQMQYITSIDVDVAASPFLILRFWIDWWMFFKPAALSLSLSSFSLHAYARTHARTHTHTQMYKHRYAHVHKCLTLYKCSFFSNFFCLSLKLPELSQAHTQKENKNKHARTHFSFYGTQICFLSKMETRDGRGSGATWQQRSREATSHCSLLHV